MPVIRVPTYEIRCDGVKPNGQVCNETGGSQIWRQDIIEEAISEGWFVTKGGRKAICPECLERTAKTSKD